MIETRDSNASGCMHSTLDNRPLLLVLNDDPEFLFLCQEHLEKANGMVIFESDNGSNAIEIFYRLDPDYVIINASL